MLIKAPLRFSLSPLNGSRLGQLPQTRPCRIVCTNYLRPKIEAIGCRWRCEPVVQVERRVVEAGKQFVAFAHSPEIAGSELRPSCSGSAPRRTSSPTAVPSLMPSRLNSVEKTDGSGSPVGVGLPVSRLSPLRLSIQIGSKPSSSRRAHDDEGRVAQVGVAGDEADDAPARPLDDPAFGDPQEADVEVVEIELPDAPIALQPVLVGLDQPFLLGRAGAGEGVVGRVADDHEDGRVALDPLGGVALRLELGQQQALRRPVGSRQPVSALVR